MPPTLSFGLAPQSIFAGNPWRAWLSLAVALSVGLPMIHAATVEPAAPLKVTAVRFWSLGGATRVSIETSSDFTFRSERLLNPGRIFFDILGAKPGIITRGVRAIAVGDRLLKQIRVAETQPGTTRVVLDLESDAGFTASQLSNPDRLVIELRSPADSGPSSEPGVVSVHQLKNIAPKPLDADLLGIAQPPVVAARVIPNAPGPRAFSAPPAAVAASRQFQAISLPSPPPLVLTSAPGPKPQLAAIPRLPAWPKNAPTAIFAKSTPPPAASEAKPEIANPEPPKADPRAKFVPQPAKRNTDSLTRVLGLKVGRVVLDAGHGGHDVGTNGPTGLYEKDLVLDVTLRLGKLIEEKLGAEVVYTRESDTFIPLHERTRIANQKKADLFLSIHANASPIQTVTGVETYYLNFTTDKSALDVAARENAGSENTVHELKDILQKIALKDKVDESREFASRLDSALGALYPKGTGRHDRGIKKAPFVVLIGAQMPSVLAEIGFLSNPHEEQQLRRPDYRQKLAETLLKGISSYLATLSHFQVARTPAEKPTSGR